MGGFVAFRDKVPLALAGTLAGLTLVALSPAALAAVKPAADTQPPTSPKNPKAGTVTETTVGLSWTAATDNVGVVGYNIMKQGQQLQTLGNVTKTTLTKLTPGTAYVFTVVARDAAGNVSQDSAEVRVTTKPSSDKTAPSVPGGLKISGTGPTNVTLTWSASKDNSGGIGLDGYNVYVNGTKTASSDTTTATIGNLKAGTTYTFQVTAVDLAGNESGKSGSVKGSPKGGGGGGTTPGTVSTVTTSKDIPWGLAFLPDGSGIYTERDTFNVVRVTASGQKTVLGTIKGGKGTDGEGGALGLEVSPTFNSDHFIYIYYTTANDNRIVRFTLNGNTLDTTNTKVLLSGIQRNKFHNGGRLRFSPDGKYLFAGTGDAQSGANAQNRNSLNGKVLRIRPDGSIPPDNPFGNAVWSYGHRNVQGLAFDSQGRLWEQEFGNSIMDEMNIIQKGGNYGWPACEGTSGSCGTAGFIKPVRTWPVASCSCSGITIVKNTIFLAALRGERLYTMDISGNGTTSPKAFFQGQFGRLRTVEASPDGDIWLTTSSGDKDSTPNNSNDQILHVNLN
jgi:glucose/arabinose dehydrogenase